MEQKTKMIGDLEGKTQDKKPYTERPKRLWFQAKKEGSTAINHYRRNHDKDSKLPDITLYRNKDNEITWNFQPVEMEIIGDKIKTTTYLESGSEDDINLIKSFLEGTIKPATKKTSKEPKEDSSSTPRDPVAGAPASGTLGISEKDLDIARAIMKGDPEKYKSVIDVLKEMGKIK